MLTRIPVRPISASSFLLSLGFALAVGATFAEATVTPLHQTRRVQTFLVVDFIEGEDVITSDEFESHDAGQFAQDANCQGGVPGDQGTSAGSQLSYIEPQLILAEGSHQAQGEIDDLATFVDAFGESHFVSVFSVDEPTEVRLLATITASGNGRANLTYRVENGEIFIYRGVFDGTDSIDDTRTLPPGTYELNAHTSGFGQAFEGGGEPAFGSFSFSLEFPAPADVEPGTPGALVRMTPVVAPNPIRGDARILAPTQDREAGGPGPEVLVLDLSGRLVRRFEEVGPGGIVWDTRDDAGRPVAAGVYLVRGGAGGSTRAVVLR